MHSSRIIPPTKEGLIAAAERLREGKLVGIPTETVYGLGGNALLKESIQKIYSVKGRPATDPLICHLANISDAVKLWDSEKNGSLVKIARCLGENFWPGPLTIVAPAAKYLPLELSSGTGLIGVRIPDHPVTLELLNYMGGIPIAAPSANRFGHVSPTSAKHVLDDLGTHDPDLTVIDGGVCEFGIESTVIRVVSPTHLEVIRRGAGILVSDLKNILEKNNLQCMVEVRKAINASSSGECGMDGPGQLLTHYAPDIQTFLVTPESFSQLKDREITGFEVLRNGIGMPLIKETVVIDLAGMLGEFKNVAKAYQSLSESGDGREACQQLFELLRWAESYDGVAAILVPFPSKFQSITDERFYGIEDRLFRAASGRIALLFP